MSLQFDTRLIAEAEPAERKSGNRIRMRAQWLGEGNPCEFYFTLAPSVKIGTGDRPVPGGSIHLACQGNGHTEGVNGGVGIGHGTLSGQIFFLAPDTGRPVKDLGNGHQVPHFRLLAADRPGEISPMDPSYGESGESEEVGKAGEVGEGREEKSPQ